MSGKLLRIDGEKLLADVKRCLKHAKEFGQNMNDLSAEANHLVGGLSHVLGQIEPRVLELFHSRFDGRMSGLLMPAEAPRITVLEREEDGFTAIAGGQRQ